MTQRIRKHGPEAGFTLLEILITTAIVLVLTAIAIPSYSAAKRSSNASSAAASVEGYNKAIQSYSNEWNVIPLASGNMSGAEITPPTPACATGGELTSLDAAALAAGLTRSGYLFTMKSAGTATGVAACPGAITYDIVATPTAPGTTGITSFCVDQTGEYQLATPAAQAGPADGVACGAIGFTERVGS